MPGEGAVGEKRKVAETVQILKTVNCHKLACFDKYVEKALVTRRFPPKYAYVPLEDIPI